MFSPEKQTATSSIVPSTPVTPNHEPRLPYREPVQTRKPRYDPRSWGWKVWLCVVVAVVFLVAAIVGGILGGRANAYPDYFKINYQLQDTYEGDTFFNQFDYFTGDDPTRGFITYLNSTSSTQQNLTSISSTSPSPSPSTSSLLRNNSIILRVDTSDRNATTGRRSVRITSKKTYTTGLFIFDIIHSPYGCATWPALWLTDPANWPDHGEIDIIEAVNMGDTGNQMTLHTNKGCKIGKKRRRKQTGEALSYDCWNATNYNEGCGTRGASNTFGREFNDLGGGVYAMELRKEGVRIWMFPRDSIPVDIRSSEPDPSTWGKALADFPNLECDIEKHFKDQRIVVNIDLCGDWAGRQEVFGMNEMCTGSCEDWVTYRAESFEEAYWEFGGFRVYERE